MLFKDDNLMLDLETLDTKPGAVLLSIGAVVFNQAEGLKDELHVVLSRPQMESFGFTTSADTLAWWSQQSAEARKTLDAASSEEAVEVREGLWAFKELFSSARKKMPVWGNGADFDNVLLAAVYERLGLPLPWGKYNNRCFRTLKNLRRDITVLRDGVHHNALDDAKHQALHALAIAKELGL